MNEWITSIQYGLWRDQLLSLCQTWSRHSAFSKPSAAASQPAMYAIKILKTHQEPSKLFKSSSLAPLSLTKPGRWHHAELMLIDSSAHLVSFLSCLSDYLHLLCCCSKWWHQAFVATCTCSVACFQITIG